MQLGARSTIFFTLLAGLLWPAVVRGLTLAGRFYPEKHTCFAGQPVFIDFEISNTGDQPAWIDQRMGEPCVEPGPIEVVGAKHHGWDTGFGCFGGVPGSCSGGTMELKPGAKHTARVFLSARFQLDHPSTYQVHALRRLPFCPLGEWTPPQTALSKDFASDFQITLVQGSEEELEAPFQPYIEGRDHARPG